MNIKERLNYFWNVTLGEDYTEQEEIETSDNPELAELKASLEKIKEMENKFNKPASNKKGGKGNSLKDKVVETVVIDPKAVEKLAEVKNETANKEIEER